MDADYAIALPACTTFIRDLGFCGKFLWETKLGIGSLKEAHAGDRIRARTKSFWLFGIFWD